jgi:hypothetical protein
MLGQNGIMQQVFLARAGDKVASYRSPGEHRDDDDQAGDDQLIDRSEYRMREPLAFR